MGLYLQSLSNHLGPSAISKTFQISNLSYFYRKTHPPDAQFPQDSEYYVRNVIILLVNMLSSCYSLTNQCLWQLVFIRMCILSWSTLIISCHSFADKGGLIWWSVNQLQSQTCTIDIYRNHSNFFLTISDSHDLDHLSMNVCSCYFIPIHFVVCKDMFLILHKLMQECIGHCL